MSEAVLEASPEPPTPAPSSSPTAQQRRSSFAQYRTLLSTLTFSEFKLRFAHSVLGYFWTLSKPLMLFGVMYVVFSEMLRFGDGIPYYPVILLTGIMLQGFFAEATTGAVTILVARADLLRKASFPRSVLPVSVVGTALMVFACNLLALALFVAIAQVPLRWTWLLILPLLLELIVLTIGASLLLSGLYVYMRDIGQLWVVMLQLLFYATPIIYPFELLQQNDVPEWGQQLLISSPLAQIIQDTRWALAGGTDSAADIAGPWAFVPYTIVLGTLALGALVYSRYSSRLAEHV